MGSLPHPRGQRVYAHAVTEAVEDFANAALWPTDITPLCVRLARRNARKGMLSPVAAAMSRCARAEARLSVAAFAARERLDPKAVLDLEAGRVPFEHVPDEVCVVLGPTGIDLLALADLDAELTAARQPSR